MHSSMNQSRVLLLSDVTRTGGDESFVSSSKGCDMMSDRRICTMSRAG